MKQYYLGIEFGSTRVKAVLIDGEHRIVKSGDYTWKSSLENGVWTYHMEDVQDGLRTAIRNLGELPGAVSAMGISGMMHGYLAFDKDWNLLAPFRTWQNTMTGEAAEQLTAEFGFNIPQRWSIAHLYQAVLNGEAHVKNIAHITTLAGYVHYLLTGENVLGVGEASGMFPIDSEALDYDAAMLEKFDALIAKYGFAWTGSSVLPKVLTAGQAAGALTQAGSTFLDGLLSAGIPFCPPEGDAGTGMVATNSVRVRTGNVSAGTSIFAMVVLEHKLARLHPEVDLVTTPAGDLAGMSHANNFTSDLNAWVGLFREFAENFGINVDMNELFGKLYNKALEGDKDCGGLVAFNYLSGEVITGLDSGKPLFLRGPESKFDLPNFARAQLCSAAATLSIGMEILADEHVKIDKLLGHGGYFKAPLAGQKIMAAALEAPVSVMKTAGEGGPWGIALLASYMQNKAEGETLEAFLDSRVFSNEDAFEVKPDPEDIAGFKKFLDNYKKSLPVEKAAVEAF